MGRITGDEDRRWKPKTYHAKQCGKKIHHPDFDLCEECINLELDKVKGTQNPVYWNGRVTDGYETIHFNSAIAGGNKFYDKHKWIESGLGPVRQVQPALATEITCMRFQEFIHE